MMCSWEKCRSALSPSCGADLGVCNVCDLATAAPQDAGMCILSGMSNPRVVVFITQFLWEAQEALSRVCKVAG